MIQISTMAADNDKNIRPRLSVVLMVKNEAANLPRALGAVKWADEIIVADTGSTDDTVEVAEKLGARVVHCAWRGFGATRAAALKHAGGDWVLTVDADEVISPELAEEIRRVVSQPDTKFVAYRLPFLTNFLGRWIRHSGWHPEYHVRLYRHGRAHFNADAVHEKIITDGSVGSLSGLIYHYTDPTIGHYLAKMDLYTRLSAERLHASGRRCRWWDLLVRPPFMFLKMYILQRGFLDGWQGLVLAFFSSMHVLTKYAQLKVLSTGETGLPRVS